MKEAVGLLIKDQIKVPKETVLVLAQIAAKHTKSLPKKL
jgi:hypothetical protein